VNLSRVNSMEIVSVFSCHFLVPGVFVIGIVDILLAGDDSIVILKPLRCDRLFSV
jgi:hypothetical protein